MATLFITWNPDISLLTLGSFQLRYYSLCWIIGLTFAYFFVRKLFREQGYSDEQYEPLFVYCFVGVLIGARLGHCLFYEPAYYLAHPLEMLLPFRPTADGWRFTGYEGLSSHGGVICIIIAMLLYARKMKVSFLMVLDNVCLAAPLTGACIRLGNLMNSEIVGRPTDLPWGFIFANNGETFARHPAQLYEALAYIAIFLVGYFLLYRRKGGRQRVGTGYFFGYCLATVFTFRFFVEFIKEVQVDFEQGLALDMGQLLSIPFILLGAACMAGLFRRPKKKI